jgi:hypothetical protein
MRCCSQNRQIERAISQVHEHDRMKNDRAEPADDFVQDAQGRFRQPSAQEISRLTYEELCVLRVCVQEEARNHFAHLLNRGSSLE